LASAPYCDLAVDIVAASTASLVALDDNRRELADQATEDEGTVAAHAQDTGATAVKGVPSPTT
jgi:hypothetical protein